MGFGRGARLVVAGLAALTVVTSCGGDDDGDDEADGSTSGSKEGSSTACATDASATFPVSGEIELQGGAAVKLADSAYTIYAGDFDVAPDRFSGATAGEGQHLVTLAITTFNATETPPPLGDGQTIEYTDEFGVLTFSVVLNEGATPVGNNAGASGTVEVVSVDDSSICVEVDYADDEKAVSGTVKADII